MLANGKGHSTSDYSVSDRDHGLSSDLWGLAPGGRGFGAPAAGRRGAVIELRFLADERAEYIDEDCGVSLGSTNYSYIFQAPFSLEAIWMVREARAIYLHQLAEAQVVLYPTTPTSPQPRKALWEADISDGQRVSAPPPSPDTPPSRLRWTRPSPQRRRLLGGGL